MQKLFVKVATFLPVALILTHCIQPPDYPVEPVIEYIGMNKKVLNQNQGNNFTDTLEVYLKFTDGDGDLGDKDSSNIFYTDSRTGFENVRKINPISELGSGNGVSGELYLKFLSGRVVGSPDICCAIPERNLVCFVNAAKPTDTMSFFIRIRDRAGNYSNTVKTEVFQIKCN